MDTVEQLPTALWIVAGVAAIGIVASLIDLALHDVKQLPRAAWAAIIVLVSFPIGAALYFVVGRVSGPKGAGREPPTSSPSSPLQRPVTEIDIRPADSDPAQPHPQPRTSTLRSPIISTSGLAKQYGDIWALRDVDLEVPEHSIYGLIGPNGAGKTTMLSILAGLRRPSHGQVTMEVDRAQIAVVIDTPQFEPWLTAREIVDLARRLTAGALPADRVDAALSRVGLTEAADRRVAGFSRGMLQRLGLATGLVGQPDVLILDEPSSALDPAGRREVLDLIGELSGTITIVLSTHVLADVQQVCDVVGV
ncbi:MAG: ATP-binding cassette domain-containing protein, partial [Nitriliruptoraceae bacterium]